MPITLFWGSASSSMRRDAALPTTSGATIPGKSTEFRIGSTGSVSGIGGGGISADPRAGLEPPPESEASESSKGVGFMAKVNAPSGAGKKRHLNPKDPLPV